MLPRITVYKQHGPLEQHVYTFWLDEYTMTLILDEYREEYKETPRHKWKICRFYSRLHDRNATLTRDMVNVPNDIRVMAWNAFTSKITVEE